MKKVSLREAVDGTEPYYLNEKRVEPKYSSIGRSHAKQTKHQTNQREEEHQEKLGEMRKILCENTVNELIRKKKSLFGY